MQKEQPLQVVTAHVWWTDCVTIKFVVSTNHDRKGFTSNIFFAGNRRRRSLFGHFPTDFVSLTQLSSFFGRIQPNCLILRRFSAVFAFLQAVEVTNLHLNLPEKCWFWVKVCTEENIRYATTQEKVEKSKCNKFDVLESRKALVLKLTVFCAKKIMFWCHPGGNLSADFRRFCPLQIANFAFCQLKSRAVFSSPWIRSSVNHHRRKWTGD